MMNEKNFKVTEMNEPGCHILSEPVYACETCGQWYWDEEDAIRCRSSHDVEEKEYVGMKCNMCGKDMDIFDKQTGISFIGKLLGYGSEFDGDVLNIHICCDCLDKIIKCCKISPLENYK